VRHCGRNAMYTVRFKKKKGSTLLNPGGGQHSQENARKPTGGEGEKIVSFSMRGLVNPNGGDVVKTVFHVWERLKSIYSKRKRSRKGRASKGLDRHQGEPFPGRTILSAFGIFRGHRSKQS